MPNVRFGIRYTTDVNKDLTYLQTQKDNEAEPGDFARPGELFINEPLEKIYFCDSVTKQFKLLNPDLPEFTTSNKLSSAVSSAPLDPNSSCETGQFYFDLAQLYVCVAPNTWRRTSLTSWVP